MCTYRNVKLKWCAVQREANKLVEEFMLLANMSVAALIADAFPGRALLRRHPPPNQRKLEEVSKLSNSLVRSTLAQALHEGAPSLMQPDPGEAHTYSPYHHEHKRLSTLFIILARATCKEYAQ